MPAEKIRIRQRIALPSFALSQFPHQAVFDEVACALFTEQVAALQNSGMDSQLKALAPY